jgi:DNA-binding MarR family transcriptional regulator
MSHSFFLDKYIDRRDRWNMEESELHITPAGRDDALEAMIGYNLRRASAFALNDFAVELSDAFLRPVTYAMLALIDERPGIRAAELCRVLGIKSANMVALIAELEERGLVERDEHAGDKRVHILRLTQAARDAMPAWRQRVGRHEDRFLHRLTTKERATLLRLLRLIWMDEPD